MVVGPMCLCNPVMDWQPMVGVPYFLLSNCWKFTNNGKKSDLWNRT